MINHKDIEIFILTYNRKEFLKKAVESVLNQTVKGLKLTIVDNGSTDGTADYIRDLCANNENISCFRHDTNIPVIENMKYTINLAKADYMLMFHDDDMLHPQYIESILKILSEDENIDFIWTRTNIFKSEDEINIQKFNKLDCQIFDRIHFDAKMLINKASSSVTFPGVLFKTENVKRAVLNDDINHTGAIADNIILAESITGGKSVFVKNKLYFYRNHPNQESETLKLTPDELITCLKFFKTRANESTYSKVIFNVFSYYRLLRLYKHYGLYNGGSTKELVKNAYNRGAINMYVYILFEPYGIFLRPFNKKKKKILQNVKHVNETFMLKGEA